MKLTPEQKTTVASWVSTGDTLATVQKKLANQFNLTLTYMDVRLLVDDLNLTLKDALPAPTAAQADLSKLTPQNTPDQLPNNNLPAESTPESEEEFADEAIPPQMPEHPDADAGAPSNLKLEVDNVTLMPGAVASGTVTFTDGVTGKWIIDQNGRPGFTQISQPGYRPSQADAQAFMRELEGALRKKGF